MLKLLVGTFLLLAGLLHYSPSFRMSYDTLAFTGDKIQHCAGSYMLTLAYWKVFSLSAADAAYLALISGTVWEIKDAYVPYEKHGWIGGDGFSTNDLIADTIGIFMALITILILHTLGV